MGHPIIGWEREVPVPDKYQFNQFLSAENGRLQMAGFDLMALFEDSAETPTMPSPLEVVYLPLIGQRIAAMRQIFADVIDEIGYPGQFHYAYASKANAAEEVVRTTLGSGAHHEMSSTIDIEIARMMVSRGLLTPDRMAICNGFKPGGSDYANNIVRFKREHANLIPVMEDLSEIPPLIASQLPFDVGIRQKCYGRHENVYDMDEANSRFGMHLDDVWRAADYIEASPNLTLKLYHAMVGSQILHREDFIDWLEPPIEIFAKLRQKYPSLSIFNFGGGMPVPMTLDFNFDYHAFVRLLLTRLRITCERYGVPAPDIMGEFGRYTTAEHGAQIFKVILVKENNSDLPWYIIDGSIMSSFPDAWALSEHFIVLPLNHLDKPFQQVQLGGVTCDSDDVYPPKPSKSPLYMPVETDELYLGFFSIGAYQEMLSGVKGSKHCVLPEAQEVIIDRTADGNLTFEVIGGQQPADVLRNLGYQVG